MEYREYKALVEDRQEKLRDSFLSLSNTSQYSKPQKKFAYGLIKKNGVRSAAAILGTPRRTLQRWCRADKVQVARCPAWVFEWAKQRQRKRKTWIY